ncbi:MAG: hypothetical protein ACK52I_11810, partial [Pseudomonadota bacterium]
MRGRRRRRRARAPATLDGAKAPAEPTAGPRGNASSVCVPATSQRAGDDAEKAGPSSIGSRRRRHDHGRASRQAPAAAGEDELEHPHRSPAQRHRTRRLQSRGERIVAPRDDGAAAARRQRRSAPAPGRPGRGGGDTTKGPAPRKVPGGPPATTSSSTRTARRRRGTRRADCRAAANASSLRVTKAQQLPAEDVERAGPRSTRSRRRRHDQGPSTAPGAPAARRRRRDSRTRQRSTATRHPTRRRQGRGERLVAPRDDDAGATGDDVAGPGPSISPGARRPLASTSSSTRSARRRRGTRRADGAATRE